MDDIKRWKDNGSPRKGWLLEDVIDNENIESVCEWCGTNIRYIHCLLHPEGNLKTTCGCICAEHLTQDYVNPRKKELKLKSNARKKNLHQKRSKEFYLSFKKSKNGNYYHKHKGHLIIVFIDTSNKIRLKIDKTWGKKAYEDISIAASTAYDYLMNEENQ